MQKISKGLLKILIILCVVENNITLKTKINFFSRELFYREI